MKKKIVVIISVALLAGAGFGIHYFIRARADKTAGATIEVARVPVVVTPVARKQFERRLTVSGNVQAKDFAMVSPRMKGLIDAVYVDEGDAVVAGKTKLFQLDAVNVTQAVEIARQQFAVAACAIREKEANRERIQADYNKARLDYERFKRLYEKDHAVTKDALEVQESRFLQLRATLKHAGILVELSQKQAEQAAAALTIAQKNLKDSLVLSPINGRVSQRFMEPGESGAPGRPVVRVENLSVVEISVFLPAEYYTQILPGKTHLHVTVSGITLADQVVSYRSPTAHPALRTFEVRCLVANPPAGIVPGVLAEVLVVFERREGLAVPMDAIQMRGGQTVVFVVENETARITPVEIGLQNDGRIEIRSGLSDNAKVVSRGQYLIEDGTPVLVVKGGV